MVKRAICVVIGGEIVTIEPKGGVVFFETQAELEKRFELQTALGEISRRFRGRPLKSVETARLVDESDPDSDVELVDAAGRAVAWLPRNDCEKLRKAQKGGSE